MPNNESVKDIYKKFDFEARLNDIGKKAIVKDYKNKGKMVGVFREYYEKMENENIDLQHLNINTFVETLVLTNTMYLNNGGKISTKLYYTLPKYEKEIQIELGEKLELKKITYEN